MVDYIWSGHMCRYMHMYIYSVAALYIWVYTYVYSIHHYKVCSISLPCRNLLEAPPPQPPAEEPNA